ncbi:hypothetical protein [Chenggangzhangella methanolivorans]|uniref:Uncharacterized protein n=1 Tax=Chenggangzhangella methanolivorans TaxID=1437009 RepID=A0A9E6UPN1_9HYPH|nr:hypothetical protein [Chenggangzhangella methanolivorans]QZO01594.1 hypothetical protein K6K41_09420 [Chenggangzhangella methanolivorans]
MTADLIDAIAGWFSGLRFSEPDAFALSQDELDGEDEERFDSALSPLEEFR